MLPVPLLLPLLPDPQPVCECPPSPPPPARESPAAPRALVPLRWGLRGCVAGLPSCSLARACYWTWDLRAEPGSASSSFPLYPRDPTTQPCLAVPLRVISPSPNAGRFPSSPRSSGGVSSSPCAVVCGVGLCFTRKGPSGEGGWKLRAKADKAARLHSHPRQLALLCTAPGHGAVRHKALSLASVISWGWLSSGEAGDGKRAACSASAAFVVVAAWGKLSLQSCRGGC